jgi:hypothetical protein
MAVPHVLPQAPQRVRSVLSFLSSPGNTLTQSRGAVKIWTNALMSYKVVLGMQTSHLCKKIKLIFTANEFGPRKSEHNMQNTF